MVLYKCDICDFKTNIKTHHTRHLKTNKHIKNIKEFESIKNNENKFLINCSLNEQKKYKNNEKSIFSCELCNSTFSTRYNLLRHKKKNCNNLQSNEDIEILKLKKDIEKLKLQNIEKKEGNINNFVNNNSNNKITININNYGDEKNFLKKSLIKKILEMPFNGIPELIEKIHFNNEYPENQNIRLLNKKDNKLQIMKDKKWNYVNKNETFKNLIEDKNLIMENLYKKININ